MRYLDVVLDRSNTYQQPARDRFEDRGLILEDSVAEEEEVCEVSCGASGGSSGGSGRGLLMVKYQVMNSATSA